MRKIYDINNPKMLNSAVCFIDILGFTNMIEESCKNNSGDFLLNNLWQSISSNINLIKPSTQISGYMKIFTDNIVIGKPILDDGESELGSIFLGFAAYQLSLILEGFFVRGGVSIGDYYANEYLSFGPALLEAHSIECCLAQTPRIVLSNDVKKLVKHHLSYYSNPMYAPQVSAIFEDADGEWFINYLEATFIDRDTAGDSYAKKVIEKHRDMVIRKKNQYKNNPKILNKYEWVEQYHNHFCNLNFPKCKDLQIEGSVCSSRFKFIN